MENTQSEPLPSIPLHRHWTPLENLEFQILCDEYGAGLQVQNKILTPDEAMNDSIKLVQLFDYALQLRWQGSKRLAV